jgi:hypothetical protein
MKHTLTLSFLAAVFCILLVACSPNDTTVPTEVASPSSIPTVADSTPAPTEMSIAEPTSLIVPEHEISLVAKTLRGECYDDQHDDKREVVKVICNRVSVGGFGDSIESVITAPHQFAGYSTDNVPTANDYEIAREILTQWYEGGCIPLGEYLFFSSGGNHKNIFSKTWKEKQSP